MRKYVWILCYDGSDMTFDSKKDAETFALEHGFEHYSIYRREV